MNLNVIRTLTLRAKPEGYAETTAATKGLQAAHESLAKVTDTSAKGQLSLADAVSKAERRFNSSLRAQQDFEKVQRQMNLAVAQNPALQERANAVLRLASQHFEQASRGGRAYAEVQAQLQARAVAAAGSLGGFGSVLASLGPVGLAVGAGLAVVTLGIHSMVKAANELAERAGKMVDFAETTGLTTTQLQALQKAAAFVGIEAEKVGAGFEKFTLGMEGLRRGSGELFEGLNRLNPALTQQLRETRSAGEAWDVFARAVAGANREQANALSRAAFGRQGVPFTRLAGATVEVGGLGGLEQSLGKVNTLTAEQLKHWDELKDKIDFTSKQAQQNIASIFATPVLEAQLAFNQRFLEFTEEAKKFTPSKWLQALLLPAATDSGANAIFRMLAAKRLYNGASSVDEGGFGGFNPDVPLPRSRPQDADPRFDAAVLQKQIAAMGEAATSADKLRLAEMQLGIAGKEAGLSQEQLGRALGALRSAEALSDMNDMVSALGSAATVTELQEYRLAQLTRQLELGKIGWDTYARAVAGSQRDVDMQRERDRVGALGELATETDHYRLRVMELQRQLETGRISQETFNQGLIAAHPLFRDLSNAADTFGNSLAQAFIQGKRGLDAFAPALQGLSSQLTQIGTKSLTGSLTKGLAGGGFSFDPVSLGVGAIGAAIGAVTSIFTGNSEKKKQEVEQFRANQETIGSLQSQLARVGLNTNTREGSTKSFILDVEAQRSQVERDTKWDPAALAAAGELSRVQLLELNKQWDARELAEKEQHLQALADLRRSFDDRVFAATTDTSTEAGALLALARRQSQERVRIEKEMYEALPDMALAHAAEELQIRNDFANKAAELAAQIAAANDARAQSLGDQLFAVLNDASTVQGQLAALELERQRALEKEATLGNANVLGVQQLYLARKLKIEQDFAAKSIEIERAREDAINGAARNIVDYINGLMGGASSTLSPQNRLASAQSSYNANLALAQGGNIDAQNKFTSLADNLEKAARDFYGSAAGYQDIRSQIIAQGLGLPAVGATTDPVVMAIRDALTAQLAAIHGTTTAVGGTTHAVDDSGMRISSDLTVQTAVLDIINASTGATKLQAESIAASTAATNGLMNTVTSLLDAIRGFNQLTAEISGRLEVLSTQIKEGTFQDIHYLDQIRVFTRDTQVNTAQIAVNTGGAPGGVAGGVIGYAAGGFVGNGIYNVDSVRARYAGGGDIFLAGGEGVLNARATAAIGGGSVIDFINRNRALPSFGGAPSASDNGTHFEKLGARLERAIVGAAVAEISSQRDEIAALKGEVSHLTRATAANKPMAPRPGTKTASAGG